MKTQKDLNRIKSVLVEAGISSRDLAERLRKSESTVSRWCTNSIQPSIETLYEISIICNIDIRELLMPTSSAKKVPYE